MRNESPCGGEKGNITRSTIVVLLATLVPSYPMVITAPESIIQQYMWQVLNESPVTHNAHHESAQIGKHNECVKLGKATSKMKTTSTQQLKHVPTKSFNSNRKCVLCFHRRTKQIQGFTSNEIH